MTDLLFPDMELQSKKPKRQESGMLDFGVSCDTTPTETGQVNGPMFTVQDSDSKPGTCCSCGGLAGVYKGPDKCICEM